MSSSNYSRFIAAASTFLCLTGCGFQLRGSYELPYQGVFVSAPSASSVARDIRRELTGGTTRVLPSAKDADAQLNILEERRDRQILSLSGAGRVREYELKMVVRYQLVDGKGGTIIPVSEIRLSRILAYDDSKKKQCSMPIWKKTPSARFCAVWWPSNLTAHAFLDNHANADTNLPPLCA